MIPAPNVVAGLLIGLANSTWTGVVLAALAWPLAFCVYVSIADRGRRDAAVANLTASGRASAGRTFYMVEAVTALGTALPVALLAHLARQLLT